MRAATLADLDLRELPKNCAPSYLWQLLLVTGGECLVAQSSFFSPRCLS